MEMDEQLYRAFLEQMHELDNFRMEYASRHPSAPLDRDDPDVKRLVEAMAFFSARTHMAGLDNIVASRLRIFQQFFPFLLSPLPAMGMVQAQPTGQFSETALLPRETRFLVSSPKGDGWVCRTMKDLRILPVFLTETKLLMRPNKGYRMIMAFESGYERADTIGKLAVYLDHLNSYQASLMLFDALKTNLVRASVVFDKKADEQIIGMPCEVSFGTLPDEEALDQRKMHPLQQARTFFHFPWQELVMTIDVPQTNLAWKKFNVCLDLSDKWPRKLPVNKDVFRLHTVPVENISRESTTPIVYEGTKERFLIRHPDPTLGFELQTILGVYKIRDGGMVPVKPGILSGGEGTYEISQKTDSVKGSRYWLCMHDPSAFVEPVTVVLDGLWHQPDFSRNFSQMLKTRPYSRTIAGVNWDLCENMVRSLQNRFQENMDEYIHLLTIKNKSALNFDDICALIQMLGTVWQGDYKPVKDLFYAVRVEQAPRAGGLLKQIYHLRFRHCEPVTLPLVSTFTQKLGRILDVWISEVVVETRMEMDRA